MRPDPLPADTMARLRKWGYAPGRYMSDCHKCGKTHSGMDKRAITTELSGMSEAQRNECPLERLVMPVAVAVVRPFIEEHHYSKSINGCKVSMAFALYEAGEIVGAVLFGPLSTTAWKRYGEKESDVVELRRLVCLDRCPRNTESWLIAQCLRVLKLQTGYKVCVSYADPHHGHCGTIYQAANWNYEGQTAPDILLQTPEGKLYHSRALRTKYNGDFKPFVKRLRKLQEDGLLTEVAVPGKHIYTYSLRGKQQPTRLPYPKGHNAGINRAAEGRPVE